MPELLISSLRILIINHPIVRRCSHLISHYVSHNACRSLAIIILLALAITRRHFYVAVVVVFGDNKVRVLLAFHHKLAIGHQLPVLATLLHVLMIHGCVDLGENLVRVLVEPLLLSSVRVRWLSQLLQMVDHRGSLVARHGLVAVQAAAMQAEFEGLSRCQ